MANYSTLTTPRLTLRPIQREDCEAIFQIASTYPEMTKFMTWEAPEKIEDTIFFFEKRKPDLGKTCFRWTIRYENECIGIISLEDLKRIEGPLRYDSAVLGYWLHPEYCNQGFMTEAGKTVIQYGFENMDLHKIIVGHVSENIASQRVIEKLGFRLVGEQKDHWFRDGQWWDHKCYEMVKRG